MGRRIELHNILCSILGTDHAYFQPPETIRLSYPCIVYQREPSAVLHADDFLYKQMDRYTLTYIDSNPDNVIADRILQLQYCKMDRIFTSDNLNHYVFTIYF